MGIISKGISEALITTETGLVPRSRACSSSSS